MDNQPGPSGIKKRHCSDEKKVYDKKKKLTDTELLQLLEESGGSSDEHYVPDTDDSDVNSSSESEEENFIDPIRPHQTLPSLDEIKWNDRGALKQILFQKTQELLVQIPGQGAPIDFFEMIIDDDFLQTIVERTNSYAVEVLLRPETSTKSRITNFKDLTLDELKIFLALLLHTGTISLSRLNDYWKTDPLFNLPVFRKYMSRNRFLLILRCLHFTSPDMDPADRLGKIRFVADFFNNKMGEIYYPGRELSLDEAMVLYRGRLQFKQYIKNKRHKYGMKLYMLTEPNGLILKFRVYEGATDVYGGSGHTEKIVLHLLEEKLGVGHAVYLDNFYNSVNLARKLLQQNTYCTGTLRAERKDNPKEVMSANLKRGENKSMFCNGVHVGKWRDKRNVQYISTEFGSEMGIFKNKRNQESEKPSAIIGYNAFMSGIDRQDQMMAYYPCSRKTIRWYKKLFMHVLQMSMINAYFLYNKYSRSDQLRLYDFRLDVIRNLLARRPITNLPQIPPGQINVHSISKVEKIVSEKKGTKETKRVSRKECKECRKNKIRKQTVYECKMCPGQPGFCLNCFEDYHKNVQK